MPSKSTLKYSQEELRLLLLEDLIQAYHCASRHKRSSPGRLHFELWHEEELMSLADEILERRYAISPSKNFLVLSPVPREVIAADFRDRVIHHYLHTYMSPALERRLIADCYSCLPGRGVHYGVNRLERHIRSATEDYRYKAYALQCDIRGYFMHINRALLLEKALRLMDIIARERHPAGYYHGDHPKHSWMLYLLELVILHDPLSNCNYIGKMSDRDKVPETKQLAYAPEGCGLPIGNLTSQLFSNLYLSDFDNDLKRCLKLRYYGRYVDDFYIIHRDKGFLEGLIPEIRERLKPLGLMFHPEKTRIREVGQGIIFLGVHLLPYRRYLEREVYRRISQKVITLAGTRHVPHLLETMNSYLGHLSHTRSAFKRFHLIELSRLVLGDVYGVGRRPILRRPLVPPSFSLLTP